MSDIGRQRRIVPHQLGWLTITSITHLYGTGVSNHNG